jgi:hypothetical protein
MRENAGRGETVAAPDLLKDQQQIIADYDFLKMERSP